MPFYEYLCKDCGGSFEVMQGINAQPLTDCELCEGTEVRRKIFPAGMIFKGDGFYSTSYRGGEYEAAANAEKGTSTSDSSSDDTSSGDCATGACPPKDS